MGSRRVALRSDDVDGDNHLVRPDRASLQHPTKMRKTSWAIAALFALGITACQTPATDDADTASDTPVAAGDTAGVRAAIAEMSSAYEAAERAGDAAAVIALHADDAVLLPAGEPAASGRAAVDAYLTENSSDQEDVTFTTTNIEVSDSGDLAYEVGSITAPGFAGKYLTVYRQTDAGWRIVADSWSGDAAPSADTTDGG